MSAVVTLTRKQLWLTAIMMLPCFIIGDAASHWTFGYPFRADSVFDCFYGVIVFALVLSLTRAK